MKLLYLLLACAAAVSAQKQPNTVDGKDTIVHLFEWKFDDIANECEKFLGPNGYGGVQVSPVNEVIKPNTASRSWWERYQPLSYKVVSRSGDEKQFRDMVRRCNKAGVRIYVDVVLNHMTSDWGNATGTADDLAETDQFIYPAVPYDLRDFHLPICGITPEDYTTNATAVRVCELSGLHDLNQTVPEVRKVMLDFLNLLIDAGVAGFRVDAAKHMWPKDLEYLYSHVNDLSTSHGFAPKTRPFIFQEVIDYGTEVVKKSEYTGFGRVTEFSYGTYLGQGFKRTFPISNYKNFGSGWNMLPDGDALVFVDNHDNQRGSGGGGADILTYKQPKLYKMAVAFMLSYPYGSPRVMSSFYFDNHDQGPPEDSNQNILSVSTNADGTCGNGWVCEHRWNAIRNMVKFSNAVKGSPVTNWWDNGNQQIAYSRGRIGFVAFNNEDSSDLKQTLQTGLPAGDYCDLISGEKDGNRCTGKTITVNHDGTAHIEILSTDEDGVIAINTAIFIPRGNHHHSDEDRSHEDEDRSHEHGKKDKHGSHEHESGEHSSQEDSSKEKHKHKKNHH